MLDQITAFSDSHYKRQVNPSVEGHLRSESRQEFEAKQNERVSGREAQRADRTEQSRNRLEEQLTTATRRQQGDNAVQETNQGPSKAAELAEKLAKHVKQSRQQEARDFRQAGFSHANKSRQISQTYQQDLPTSQNRIIDEMA